MVFIRTKESLAETQSLLSCHSPTGEEKDTTWFHCEDASLTILGDPTTILSYSFI